MRTSAGARVAALLAGLLGGFHAVPALAAGPDLEQRLAELKETLARSGSRNVSLHIYGQVNQALLSWDDGKAGDTYVVDNDTSSSRLGFIGLGKIGNGAIAGYRIEMEFGARPRWRSTPITTISAATMTSGFGRRTGSSRTRSLAV